MLEWGMKDYIFENWISCINQKNFILDNQNMHFLILYVLS